MRKLLSLCALLLLVSATSAFALDKGSMMFSLQLGQGQGDFVDVFDPLNEPGSDNYVNGIGHLDQFQMGGEAWYMFTENYAFTGAFAIGVGTEKYEAGNFGPGESGGDFADEDKMSIYKSNSMRIRFGADRVGKIGEGFEWFMGPGLEFWSGKTTRSIGIYDLSEHISIREFDSPSMTRFGVNGRVGGTMMLTSQIGITGRIGHSYGRAAVEEKGAKASWFSGTWDAMWGLTYAMGGAK
jgi:hypothetical protein